MVEGQASRSPHLDTRASPSEAAASTSPPHPRAARGMAWRQPIPRTKRSSNGRPRRLPSPRRGNFTECRRACAVNAEDPLAPPADEADHVRRLRSHCLCGRADGVMPPAACATRVARRHRGPDACKVGREVRSAGGPTPPLRPPGPKRQRPPTRRVAGCGAARCPNRPPIQTPLGGHGREDGAASPASRRIQRRRQAPPSAEAAQRAAASPSPIQRGPNGSGARRRGCPSCLATAAR